jgi:transcriptional regulator with XRE-family HTH domain
MTMVTVGSYIKSQRIQRGLTRKEVSRKTKISQMELWRIESDHKKYFNLQYMAKIAKALDFSLANMLIETGLSSSMTEAEKNLLTDPDFERIFVELDRRKDLKKEDKRKLADILLRIIKSFSETGK